MPGTISGSIRKGMLEKIYRIDPPQIQIIRESFRIIPKKYWKDPWMILVKFLEKSLLSAMFRRVFAISGIPG